MADLTLIMTLITQPPWPEANTRWPLRALAVLWPVCRSRAVVPHYRTLDADACRNRGITPPRLSCSRLASMTPIPLPP